MFHRGIMSLFASSLLLATRLPHASAIDLEKLCNEHMLLCLESFVWCDRPTNDRHCEYPDDTFPLKHSGNSGVAGLLWSTKYNLTWSKTDLEYPVLIIWRASRSEDERKDFLWQKSEFVTGAVLIKEGFVNKFLPRHHERRDKLLLQVQSLAKRS